MTSNELEVRADSRALTADEIDAVSGGVFRGDVYGGRTPDGTWVTCGSVVLINGHIYIGGINGPIRL